MSDKVEEKFLDEKTKIRKEDLHYLRSFPERKAGEDPAGKKRKKRKVPGRRKKRSLQQGVNKGTRTTLRKVSK